MNWKQEMDEDDVIYRFNDDWNFLSNFYFAFFNYDEVDYTSVEHAYQAFKATTEKERNFILDALTPGEAKRRGRQITCREDWDKVKLNYMYDLCRAKFAQNEYCRESLLKTGKRKLIEGNTWGDTFWGVCNGTGQNHLGRILMQIRSEIGGFINDPIIFQEYQGIQKP